MAIRIIRQEGDEILNKKSRPVEIIDDKLQELIYDMLETMHKQERKKYGQFFTSMETAQYMASLFVISEQQESISILDAGAGSGAAQSRPQGKTRPASGGRKRSL